MRLLARNLTSINASAAALLAVLLGSSYVAGAAGAAPANATKPAFLIVPHTHWEGAVFKTREEYLEMGLPNILKVLRLLKTYTDYHFVLDQACYVQPFLERYPEEEAAFRKFVKQGRLQVIGGTDCMPERQYARRRILHPPNPLRQGILPPKARHRGDEPLGRRHLRTPRTDTADSQAGGLKGVLAEPRHSGWERSLRVLLGRDRRHAAVDVPAAQWIRARPRAPDSLPGFTKFIKERYEVLTPFTRGKGACRVGLSGGDVYPPEEHLPRMVEQYNRQADAPCGCNWPCPPISKRWWNGSVRTAGRCSKGNSTRCSKARIAAGSN